MLRRPAVARALALLALASGCAGSRLVVTSAPDRPFDAVFVPGCPNEEDGRLSRCQMGRALWAAEVWRRGWARFFVTSGSAVHSRFVEAEAIAAGMHALGVPADRIYLEPNALHTDENMYFSAQIARALGLVRFAVASSYAHAAGGCQMLVEWNQSCAALPMDLDVVRARAEADGGSARARLAALRLPPQPDWIPLVERERRIARATGWRRPPSPLLYPFLSLYRRSGQPWIPRPPATPPRVTWADRARQLAGR